MIAFQTFRLYPEFWSTQGNSSHSKLLAAGGRKSWVGREHRLMLFVSCFHMEKSHSTQKISPTTNFQQGSTWHDRISKISPLSRVIGRLQRSVWAKDL